jgi:hypothetical protein
VRGEQGLDPARPLGEPGRMLAAGKKDMTGSLGGG